MEHLGAAPAADALIRWDITDRGFAMHLSGEVPGRIAAALADPAFVATMTGGARVDGWAVHAGGRSILDAVEQALHLPADAGARFASCVTLSRVSLAVVTASALDELAIEEPRLGLALMASVARRLSLRMRQLSARLGALLTAG